MKRALTFLAFCLGALSAPAAIEILYIAPSDTSPVLGSISTDSEAFKEAKPVEDKEGWLEVVREDYYSGFIARDSLTPEGEVELGTALLLTPSKEGTVLTTIEEGDEVTVNLVDEWTEITVQKAIPGYFQPSNPEDEDNIRRNAPPPPSSLTYAEDPLLERARGTRYVPPPVSNPSASDPVAARGTTLTEEPMTGFEEVDSLNPAFGRTADDGSSRGYSLGAGSTPIPAATAADGSSTFRSGSMEDPTSIARIPRENPSEVAPTQSETVDELQEEDEGPAVEDRMAELERTMAEMDAETPSEEAVEDAGEAAAIQDAATAEAEEPIPDPIEEEGDDAAQDDETVQDDETAEVIPLAPETGETGATAVAAAAVVIEEEPVEDTPVEIVETDEEVEVSEEVAEARVPGVTQPVPEEEPQLIPPTDTNRTYIGRLQRTKSGFFGGKPPHRFEIVNYEGNRIAYVDLEDVPMSSEEKFVDRIVRVYGVLVSSPEDGPVTIDAANITLR